MNEQAFFQNIARRLGRSEPLTRAPKRDVVGAPDFWLTHTLSDKERLTKFQEELAGLGGRSEVYNSLAELRSGLIDLLQELGANTVGYWNDGTLDAFELADLSVEDTGTVNKHPRWIPWAQDTASEFSQIDVGITGCSFAVADTGSIALVADRQKGRSVSLLPAVHVVLLRESQIRTRIGEVLSELTGQGDEGHSGQTAEESPSNHSISSSINFITGPSRSSDIENDLSIGVHGPAAVIAMVLCDL